MCTIREKSMHKTILMDINSLNFAINNLIIQKDYIHDADEN